VGSRQIKEFKRNPVNGGELSVDSALYLGYGPLHWNKDCKSVEPSAEQSIGRGQVRARYSYGSRGAELTISMREEFVDEVEQAICLMHRYGALGGRSANRWGSISVENLEAPGMVPLRKYDDCFSCSWPHAIGSDAKGPLI
jgi:CRISPR-associated protein Cmr1